MSTTQDFADYILDSVNDKKSSVTKMFGEYALYYDKKVVGLICDNTLFLKITDFSKKILEAVKVKTGPAYPRSKDFYIVGEEILEDNKLLKKIILGIWEDVPFKKKK